MGIHICATRLSTGFSRALHQRPSLPHARRVVQPLRAVTPITYSTEGVSQSEDTIRLLCPICLTTEFRIEDSSEPTRLECDRCRRSFDASSTFYDLTLSSGAKDATYALSTTLGTSTFQNPWVGFVYERGWRQSFASSGFPGPDREFESAMEFLKGVTGGTVMDLSCGSGLFTRRFLSSGAFKQVIAVDYSEAMLTQTQQYVNRMDPLPKTSLHLVRADVSRLPFPTGSFPAIFAGAAIHCWPNPAMALAEISRVLQPGGIFVMSTFTQLPKEIEDLFDTTPLRPLKSLIPRRTSRTLFYWDVQTLKDTCRLAGLENFEDIRSRSYIMARVNKPISQDSSS